MARIDANDGTAVVVIGSGAGGGTLANELCQRGIRVVLLEAGPAYELDDIVNDSDTMRAKFGWKDERAYSSPPPLDNARVINTKAVGGNTLVWAGCALRFEPHELRARSSYGAIAGANLLDWPLSYDELAPWYDRAEDKMGVTGTHGIPLLPANNNFTVMYHGATRIGYRRVSTGRMAINSRGRDDRPGCMQIGFCTSGCKIGAKWSPLYTEVRKAEATGRLDLRTNATALRIEHDRSGKVIGVLYTDQHGNHVLQRARVVAAAANSIESPRLLLNSASSLFPHGLANGSGQVGRNFTRHTGGSVIALFDQPVHHNRGTNMAGLIEDERRNDPSRGFVGGYHLQTSNSSPAGLAAAYGRGTWGAELGELVDNYANAAGLFIVGEDLPLERNGVTLHATRRDQNGLPIPVIHSEDHPNDLLQLEHAYTQAEALYEAAGARRVYRMKGRMGFGHLMGTNRMSRKPADGVLNKWGQAHEVPNLFVADGSQFTTSGSPNPTLTIVALAMRQAEYIAGRLRRREL